MAVEPSRLLFTASEYEALGQIGFFGDNKRLELIEGEILEMTPIGPEHAGCVRGLHALFASRLGDRAVMSVQMPVRLGNLSEPQPDLTLLAPPLERYRRVHPEAADILLLVEVSDTTIRFDREVKAPLYARHGVRETWIVDVKGETVEVHVAGTVTRHRRGETITPQAFPDVGVGVEEILG